MFGLALAGIVATAGCTDAGGDWDPEVEDRLYNSTVAAAGEFPFSARLFFSNGALLAGNGFCGGVLIKNRFVVTAAHCVDAYVDNADAVGATELRVGVGRLNLSSYHQDVQGRTVRVARAWVHPQWDAAAGFDADIAVLQLATATSGLEKAPLATDAEEQDLGWTHDVTTAIGHGGGLSASGDPDQDEFVSSNRLRKLDLEMMAQGSCKAAVEDLGAEWTARMRCGGGGPSLDTWVGVCSGDSGSPLLIQKPNGAWRTLGITSASVCRVVGGEVVVGGDAPSIFTRAKSFRTWANNCTSNASCGVPSEI